MILKILNDTINVGFIMKMIISTISTQNHRLREALRCRALQKLPLGPGMGLRGPWKMSSPAKCLHDNNSSHINSY